MRSKTRRALQKLHQFLSDAGGITAGLGSESGPEASAFGKYLWGDSASGLGAFETMMSEFLLHTEGQYEILEMIGGDLSDEQRAAAQELLDTGGAVDLTPLRDKYVELLEEPLTKVCDQILAPQGVHQTFWGLLQMMSQTVDTDSFDASMTSMLENYVSLFSDANQQAAGMVKSSIETHVKNLLEGSLGAQTGDASALVSMRNAAAGFVGYDHAAFLNMMTSMPRSSGGAALVEPFKDSQIESPTKNATTFGHLAMLSIHNQYSRKESILAGIANALVPPIEWSRCIPYLDVKINTKSKMAYQPGNDITVVDKMSLFEFFKSSLNYSDEISYNGTTHSIPQAPPEGAAAAATSDDETSPEGEQIDYSTTVGMEAFTTPQSIIPTGLSNNAFTNRGGDASIDRTRPFMSVDSFSCEVSPTTGASSTLRANLSIILHDRARLPQIGALIKPATLNKTQFMIEWGWSHPSGDDRPDGEENIYGMYINSLRQSQTFTLYQSSYSFTEDGQVKITLGLVSAGVDAVQTIDASATGIVVPGYQAVETAFEALEIARSSATDILGQGAIADLAATQTINTLTLNSSGILITAEAKRDIDEWIAKAERTMAAGGQPAQDLGSLVTAIEELLEKVGDASSTLQADLDKKINCLKSSKYMDWLLYTASDMRPGPTSPVTPIYFCQFENHKTVTSSNITSAGKYVPFGALIQLFAAQPLMQSGMYDEVQIISYPANLDAGAAAGANVCSLPVDIGKIGGTKEWGDVIKEQYAKFGGQYPVVRMIEYMAKNFIEPQMSPCYGLSTSTGGGGSGNSALKYNEETGGVEPNYEASLDVMNAVSTRLMGYYYGKETLKNDPSNPRPTRFGPIKLQVTFEVASTDADELIQSGVPLSNSEKIAYKDKTVLRIHVYDARSEDKPTLLNLIKQGRTSHGGVLIPPVPKNAFGCPPATQTAAGWNPNVNNSQMACSALAKLGILRDIPAAAAALTAERRTVLEAEIETLTAARAVKIATGQDPGAFDLRIADIETTLSTNEEAQSMGKYMLNGGAGGAKALVRFVSSMAPNIIYGEEGSQTNSISIKQRSNSRSSTTHMIRALENAGDPNNQAARGLPMRAAPADVSIKAFGNPAYKYMQNFFINTHSGTTIDNLYAITGIQHSLTPEIFTSDLKLVPLEAYGVFQNLTANAEEALNTVNAIKTEYDQYEARQARIQASQAAAAAAAAERAAIAAASTTSVSGLRDGPYNDWLAVSTKYGTWVANAKKICTAVQGGMGANSDRPLAEYTWGWFHTLKGIWGNSAHAVASGESGKWGTSGGAEENRSYASKWKMECYDNFYRATRRDFGDAGLTQLRDLQVMGWAPMAHAIGSRRIFIFEDTFDFGAMNAGTHQHHGHANNGWMWHYPNGTTYIANWYTTPLDSTGQSIKAHINSVALNYTTAYLAVAKQEGTEQDLATMIHPFSLTVLTPLITWTNLTHLTVPGLELTLRGILPT